MIVLSIPIKIVCFVCLFVLSKDIFSSRDFTLIVVMLHYFVIEYVFEEIGFLMLAISNYLTS